MTLAVVVPLRAFDLGKTRLAGMFTPTERQTLARAMADVVVAPRSTSHPLAADWFVVCDDERIASWAEQRGAQPIRVSARGLNASLDAARDDLLSSTTATWIVIAHADLPLAHDLVDIVGSHLDRIDDAEISHTVLIAPDRRRDGSNVVVVPRHLLTRWEFRYGPGSFDAHRARADELGVAVTTITDPRLAADVDTIDDLDLVRDFVASILPDWNTP